MKISFRNTVHRKIIEQCFICNRSHFSIIPSSNLIHIRCLADEEDCDLGNLYNDKIFKL